MLVLSGSNPPIRPGSFLSNLFPLLGIPLALAQPPERPLIKDSFADIVGLCYLWGTVWEKTRLREEKT